MTIDVAGWFFCVQNVKACEVVRLIDWDGLKREFEETDATLKDLADKHGVKYATARSRKSREGWEKEKKKSSTKKERAATPIKKDATPKKNVATRNTQQKSVATPRVIEELDNNDALNERQKMFCLLYLQNRFNATKAYQEAYGVSYSVAKTNGNRMLTNADIGTEIRRLKSQMHQEVYADTHDLLQEYVKQAFADMTDYVEFGTDVLEVVDKAGNPILDKATGLAEVYKRSFVILKDAHEVDGSIIQEVKKGKDGVSVKLYDRNKAMDVLLKYFGDDAKDISKELMQIQLEKARLELAEVKANALGGDDGMDDDGFLSAIDQSLDAVWGDPDE